MKLGDALRAALKGGEQKIKAQVKGPIVPGPSAVVMCYPCTQAAQVEYEGLTVAERQKQGPFRLRGWLKKDIARHLRDYHGQGEKG